jgi:hypothetical protein
MTERWKRWSGMAGMAISNWPVRYWGVRVASVIRAVPYSTRPEMWWLISPYQQA